MRTITSRSILAFALAATVCIVPAGSSAIPKTLSAQCSGSAPTGAQAATCEATFEIDEPRDPQDIGTHANFHALTSMGTVVMEWFDQNGERVAKWDCQAPGLYVHRAPFGAAVGGGPTDASSHTCRSQITNKAPFALGTQRLVVTAKARMCWSEDTRSCPFHGLLALKRVSEPI